MARAMTMDDFMRTMLTAWPDAIVDEGYRGELVVYTGYTLNKGEVVKLEDEEAY